MAPSESDLIHDWNTASDGEYTLGGRTVELNDETLRDGLQSPSARSPAIERKIEMLHLMADLGIESANIGLPGAGPHVVADVTRLAREVAEQRLPLALNCAARTLEADIRPILDIAEQVGQPIEVSCFLGSSPIRQYAEGWEIERLQELTEKAVRFATDRGAPVMYVTEDTTRADPEHLRRLYTTAVEAGARRVCIADTVGHATPAGAVAVTTFLRDVVGATGEDVKVDWHGHRDRGLAVANSLSAASAGADRIHGTALGIGERVGNAAIDLLLVNMTLLGWREGDLSRLPEYCELVAETTGVPLPDNYPVVGKDAFRTGTGVHASAILKARRKGDSWLADRIYSGVPAGMIGRHQVVEVGPMCGQSNVVCWLEDHGLDVEPGLVEAIFAHAKKAENTLAESEILAICRSFEAPEPA